MYSLPFNLVVILSLMMIWYRYYAGGIIPVVFQEYSPEKHVYKNRRNIYRYGKQTGVYLSLPVMGEWHISQAYNGKHTHKGIFACAYDFDLVNEKGNTFQNDGTKLEDFYCYNLPVIAPGAGYVTDIREGIEDNQVSEVNLEQNWGNSIVIKHLDGLFSQISHLKPGSVEVSLGDFVYKGQLIGRCGSSGRSPEPHLHFQVQTAPYVGAPTIAYPFSYYIKKQNNKEVFHSFEYPKEGETIKNFRSTNLLVEAFNFIPGKKIRVELSTKGNNDSELWTIHTNAANQTYIHSDNGLAVAYFINDGSCFYFTEYYGEKSSLLYCFYEAAYKVSLGYYEDLELTDELLPQGKMPFVISVLQDFIAPFIQFTHVKYVVVFNGCDDPSEPKIISIKSRISLEAFGKQFQNNFHEIQVQESKITQLVFNVGGANEKLIRFYEG